MLWDYAQMAAEHPETPTKEQRIPTVGAFFRPGGLLAQWHDRYEFRAGQGEMAGEIAQALDEKRHLLVEAGTGTGKTLAYLVPALVSGQRIIISTGTKALQEQLFYKDVPFLEDHLGHSLRVAYMKGRANYLCLQKYHDAAKRPVLSGLEEVEDYAQIRAWEEGTETGDRAELKELSARATVWEKMDARRELCSGQKCEFFEDCYITKMQQRARQADIIIVNHHLFFADLALRDDDFGSVIPNYQAVVFDEAHEIEDVAGRHFGLQVSNYRFDELRRDVQAMAGQHEFGSMELNRALDAIRTRAERFFALFGGYPEGHSGLTGREKIADRDEYAKLGNALEALGNLLELVDGEIDAVLPLQRRTKELSEELRFLVEGNDERYVYWVERRGRGTFLQATPIDVAEILAERLFGAVDTVVLTSATLAVADDFSFIRGRLGLESTRELVVPPHFNYAEQTLFYVPLELPDPRADGYSEQAAREITRVIEITEGRAFVLFTSHQQMQKIHDEVSWQTPYPTLVQGSAPNNALLEEFRGTPNCVLFGTGSFWQGVDVQGEQLSCVIIDKLPFAVPSDPVVAARIRNVEKGGGKPFFDYQIPQAVISLKQGFGRLIRAKADRGALVLLDRRIAMQRYGQVFFDSLPAYTYTNRREDVERFFGASA